MDSGVLGMIAHSNANELIVDWVQSLRAAETIVVVPEIADYEVRRELIRARRLKSIRHLDKLKQVLVYLPITTSAMLEAARIWAEMRNRGRPVAGKEALDADAVLAGQAADIGFRERANVIVATENVQHLGQMTHAEYWHDILADE